MLSSNYPLVFPGSTPDCTYCSLTTYETCVFQHLFFSVLLGPQVSKGVDDDTKDEVLNDDDDDNQEERQIVQKSDEKQWLLQKSKDNASYNTGIEISVIEKKC